MSKPQIKFTKYTATRSEARPYARTEPADPHAIQTLTFEDDAEETKEQFPDDNITDEPIAVVPTPQPAPPANNLEDIKRQMMKEMQKPVRPQRQPPMARRPQPEPVVRRPQQVPQQSQQLALPQSNGIPSSLKWIGGLLAAGVLFVALGGKSDGAKEAKGSDEDEYFY